MSIKSQGHSLTLVKGHSDFKVKCLTFGLYTQVSNSGPHGPLVFLTYETEFVLFLAVLENFVFPVGWDSSHETLKVTSFVYKCKPGKLSQVPPRRYWLNGCDRYPELPVMVKIYTSKGRCWFFWLMVTYCDQSMSVVRRPSSTICFQSQLLLNRWANVIQTSQEWCLGGFLPK